MRIDLSDLDRLTGIAEALERLFWCLLVVAFFTALLGSHGTGLLLLILGAAAFVVRTGLEDFVRAHREPAGTEETAAPKKAAAAKPKTGAAPKPKRSATPKTDVAPKPKKKAPATPAAEPEFTVYRAQRRPRRTKSAV